MDKKTLGAAAFTSWIVIAGLAACTSDSETTSTPSTTPDASSSTDSSTSTGTDSSTVTDSSTTNDAFTPSDATDCDPFNVPTPTVSAAPACHDLVNSAPEIGTTDDPGTTPTGTGGTIKDGLYFLTEVRRYAGATIPATYKFQQTYLLKGGKSYVVERTDTGTANVTHRKIKSQLVDGGESEDCTSDPGHVDPPGQSLTATCTKVTVYVPQFGYSATLTRQP